MFGLLFVSSHVGLYLIIVLLFLCQQFILLPCHLIMCCVNTVCCCCIILCGWWCYLGLLTGVDVCSFIGITAQVNTFHLGLWGLLSEGHTQADISVFLSLSHCHCQSLCSSLSCSISFSLFVPLYSPLSYHKSAKITLFAPYLSLSLFSFLSVSLSPASILHSPYFLCFQLSPIFNL